MRYFYLLMSLALMLVSPQPVVAAQVEYMAYEDPASHQAYIPLRDLAGILGMEVKWDPEQRAITLGYAEKAPVTLRLKDGSLAGHSLEPKPRLENGVTVVPLRRTAELLGAGVDWRNPIILVTPPSGQPVTVKYKTILGSYRISFGGYEADSVNTANARTAGYLLDGAVVAPGEVFSFNDRVGERTSQKGFLTGIIFVGQRHARDTGGGVCRTATLLHNAVEKAGLTVVERHHHSLPVTYVPYGQDATVNYGVLDYRFRNTCGSPIELDFETDGPNLTMRIWRLP